MKILKKINTFIIFIMILGLNLQVGMAQTENPQEEDPFIRLLISDSIEEKIEIIESFSPDSTLDSFAKYQILQGLQVAVINREIILNNNSVEVIAIALKYSRYNLADIFLDLFLSEYLFLEGQQILVLNYRTNNRISSMYPEGVSLSEIVDCRLMLHKDYLENNTPTNDYQAFLLNSAIQTLEEMQLVVYISDVPAPSEDRCDEIRNGTPLFSSLSLSKWISLPDWDWDWSWVGELFNNNDENNEQEQ